MGRPRPVSNGMKKILFIALFLTVALGAEAKRYPFPDDSTLEPLPADAGHPNISGNVRFSENPLNNSVTPAETANNNQTPVGSNQNPDTASEPVNSDTDNSPHSPATPWAVGFALIALVGVGIVYKKNKKI